MPQHLCAVPERYTYSSLSKMFMREKCLWRDIVTKRKLSGEMLPFVGYLFLWNLDNETSVWLACRMPESIRKRWLWKKILEVERSRCLHV